MSANREGADPDLAQLLDHALLDPLAGAEQLRVACDAARHFGFAGLCVHSRRVPWVRERLSGDRRIMLVAVVGFPSGAVPEAVKHHEAAWCVDQGADELDVVPDLAALMDHDGETAHRELASIVELGVPVKAILEAGRLEPDALELAVEVALDAGVHWLKTGSGYGPPASPELVRRLVALARGRAAVKASGGIRDLEGALALVQAGARRLGTSHGPALMAALRAAPAEQLR
ncbi:MAG: deoxyribose-phosphate aldolase [Aphanocapsa feldmannii 277cV]|uniref:Deoxyribose-phosphate aldolase n=2 Tax=Aphanocapsa feldmannii TaxID=192050 RepID=A0A524RP73_9CHRO|nr:MAG: deoxyribose-phosphate aldolase [Aphanocapsa feldmannii 277cV]TGH20181.1 MAG: deoxyribose-phosphate aldolase [Aphanocapsa feldmannii 277cI]